MIREQNREIGVLTIAVGVLLLLGLRFWTSPIARGITGRSDVTLFNFLLIPLFFVIVGAGIALALWEPEAE